MSRKRKTSGKRTGGNLDVETESGGVQAPDAVGIGAIVNAPGSGRQKIRAKIGTVTGDRTGLVIGAVIGGGTGKKP